MDISIVIVNYNVKHFLEQCLYSVQKALNNIQGEVFVVDNNSVDGSCQMVKDKFPEVNIIENKDNVGFSKANNQAIRISKGRYVLLLNPDTFVQEDTFVKCIEFCDKNADAGGVGVKMIDGKGDFLPESKRALPTPAVAFYKIFGFSALFPNSKVFGKYHLGFLDIDKIHNVEVLAGAFMLLRKSVLDKIGLLDETFFMYGEDIDLSYRINKAGYKNYYFPETTIIHYKGESTKKGSINYVMVFYKAMIIFAKKHFSSKNAKLYSLLINLAIYLRAALGIAHRILLSLFEPVLDFLIILLGFIVFTPYWEQFKFKVDNYFPPEYFTYVIPSYILVWMFFVFFFGGYEKKIKSSSLLKGVATGTAFIILIYALLPESLRYSRALIFLGSLWAIISVFFTRALGAFLLQGSRRIVSVAAKKRVAIVGSNAEVKRVRHILDESQLNCEYYGRIGVGEKDLDADILGPIQQIEDIVRINKIDEIVFCSQDLNASAIIESMLFKSTNTIEFKIAPPESVSVIGSNSINTTGDLYVVDIYSLYSGLNKRKKRLFDILSGIALLVVSPIAMLFMHSPLSFIRNTFLVLFGRLTWVGIILDGQKKMTQNNFSKGVLSPIDGLNKKNISSSLKERMNIMYAKDYKTLNDLVIVFRGFKSLGRRVK